MIDLKLFLILNLSWEQKEKSIKKKEYKYDY